MTRAILFRNETQFVKWLSARVGAGTPQRGGRADVRIGIGDDAAVVRPRRGVELILKADMSFEGVHFDTRLHPAISVGHRALARPLSDIAAMGGIPRFALISLAMSRSCKLTSRWLADFYRGFARLARRYRVAIVGGDTAITASPSAAGFADVVVVGEIRRGAALLRSGARPGDAIFVSGRLGLSRLGLEALRWRLAGRSRSGGRSLSVSRRTPASVIRSRDCRISHQTVGGPLLAGWIAAEPHTVWYVAELARACRAHLYPEPRIALGRFLSERRFASAAIDVSDGLSTDLAHLTEASHVGARIWSSLIPMPKLKSVSLGSSGLGSGSLAGRAGSRVSGPRDRRADPSADGLDAVRSPLRLALDGGEDYELLFTVPARLAARIPSAYRGVPLHRIGEIRPATAGLTLIQVDGAEVPLEPGGFDHFSNASVDG